MLGQRIIVKAVAEWRKRLRACVVAGGGQFEQDVNISHLKSRLFDCLPVDKNAMHVMCSYCA